jgi:hypothetical protein
MSVYGLPVLVDGLQVVSSVVIGENLHTGNMSHSFMGNVTASTDEDGAPAAAAWFSNIAYPLNIGSWTAPGCEDDVVWLKELARLTLPGDGWNNGTIWRSETLREIDYSSYHRSEQSSPPSLSTKTTEGGRNAKSISIDRRR